MINNPNERIEGRLDEPSTDKISGKIDGLDQAMETETEEQDAGAETYTVQPGEDLRSIAERFYGDSNAYQRIIEANPAALSDSEIVRPGLQLKIPS